MATTKFYLDRRTVRADGTCPLKIVITQYGKTALYPCGLYFCPEQWDNNAGMVLEHPQKRYLNNYITRMRADVEKFILQLMDSGAIAGMTAQDIKKLYVASLSPDTGDDGRMSFEKRFLAFIEKKHGSTRDLYEHTLKKIRLYCPRVSRLEWREINAEWLAGFDAFMARTAPSKNYRNIHLRNIRAVFNDAIDEEDTTFYPFRKFKIRPVATRKRSLSLEALRELFDYPVEEYAEIYRDLFKLIFMLIGINSVDLHRLTEITPEGRVEYTRAKTHRLYSIKVEPEAAAIIEKYRGRRGLLCIADRWTDHRNFRHQMNKALQYIGAKRSGRGGKKSNIGAFPGLSTYWARHTWATIAASLDIPKETIAAGLGHGGNTVTDIYIDFDQRKVDEANRRVLDWVLYGKK